MALEVHIFGRIWVSVDGATHFRKLFSNKELVSKNSLRRLLDVAKAIVNQFQRAFETEPRDGVVSGGGSISRLRQPSEML